MWEISIKEAIQKNTPENSVIVPATNSDSASANSNILIKFCKYIQMIIKSMTNTGKIIAFNKIALKMLTTTKLNKAIKFKFKIYKKTISIQNSLIMENNIVRIVARYIKQVFKIKHPTKNVFTTANIVCILNNIKWLKFMFIRIKVDKGIKKYSI